MAKKNRMFWESALLNNRTYTFYYDKLTELATVMFEWKNLPDTIDERFLELTLFTRGQIIFFKDDVLGYLALPVNTLGAFDVYHVPKERNAFASNGYFNNSLNEENSVLIYNSYLKKPSMPDCEHFARKLYEIDRTMDVNTQAQKTPVLIACTEEQRLTMLNMYKEWSGNMPVIFGDKSLDLKALTVLQTQAPYVVDKLRMEKTAIWNEALTHLGISNVNVQKKERMIADEMIRSQGGVIASRYSRLEMRRTAAEQINAMFGLNIEVNYREDFREADDEVMFHGETGNYGEQSDLAIDLRTR